MAFFDFIKSLSVHLSPKFQKQTGTNSAESKIKAKNTAGDIAGRDIHKTYVSAQHKEEELPYVYTTGLFGGNGVLLKFSACRTINLSDQFVFLDNINVLGRAIKFDSSSVIKAGDSLSHSGIDDLDYPSSNEDHYLEIYFRGKNNKHFVAKQKLLLKPRQDGRFNIDGLSDSEVSVA